MLTFRMDETNFAEGDRDGIRIATGAGLKADFDEFAADGDTLGLWHLHDGGCQGEGTGLEDASGGGHDLTNDGAESVENGYRFVRADSDELDVAYVGDPGHQLLTLECWMRDFEWARFVWNYGDLVHWGKDNDNFLYVLIIIHPVVSALSGFRVYQKVAGVYRVDLPWINIDAYNLLTGPDPIHVAAVLDSTAPRVSLYVNGVKRAETAVGLLAMPAGDHELTIGSHPNPLENKDYGGVIDEVCLSAAARYTQDFTPERLLPSGTFISLTFDAVRVAADWADLIRTQSVPQGCDTDWHVRAADETDAGGAPQAVWQPYSGDPPTLPDGRYFQWRASLEADSNHLTSPTIESVEALASEAGYNLYHASGSGPECLDYDEPWGRVGPSVTEVQTDALTVETVHWLGIRPVDADGRESPIAQGEVRLEIDAQGEQEPDRPAGALAATATPLPLGAARLQWRYRVGLGGVLPQTFRVFGDGGTGTIDYETPLDEVPWREGQSWYAWTSDPLTPGVEHQLAARAVTAGGVWDEQPAIARVTPDATPPAEVDALEAETAP